MTITVEQRQQLLVADRTRDIEVISHIVDDMLVEHPDVTPLDIEMCFRDAAAQTYLIAAGGTLSIVLGMPAWRDALNAAGVSPDQNRAALAAIVEE